MVRLLPAMFLAIACSNMDSRPERAEKLKPILVEINAPTASEPAYKPALWGEEVRLDFHFIAPALAASLTAVALPAPPKPLTVPLPALTVLGSAEVSEYPGLQHTVVHSSVRVPSLQELAALNPELAAADFVKFQYALEVSDGSRSIPISGDFPAYRDSTVAEASWNFQGSSITEPTVEAQSGTKLAIKSQVLNQQNEPVRIAWFVSDGTIKNRRAAETEWELPGPGQYTLIFTVRGKRSRTSTLAIKSVNVL